MNRAQSYDWMFIPKHRQGFWNHLSMLARGVALELWRLTDGRPYQLYRTDDWENTLLRWMFVEGNERRAVRRALRELVQHKFLLIGDDGTVTVEIQTRTPMPEVRFPLSASERQAIIERDGARCAICGDHVVDLDAIDIDHLMPVSRGGTNHPSNLRVTHASCNRARGNREVS